MASQIAVNETPIPGLYDIDLVLHGDNRGWFKENWQRAQRRLRGMADFLEESRICKQ